jgi:E3 ubiquitin-protein ligase RNF146
MCRTTIPDDYLNNPVLVSFDDDLLTKTTDVYQWFYEGRNGFWQYDLRTSQELEEAHNKGEATCTILVAGFLYVVDFEKMYQFRQNDASRRRKVKREKSGAEASVPRKGVAGIRLHSDGPETQPLLPPLVDVADSSGDSSVEILENEISVVEVSDDDEGPASPRRTRQSSQEEDLIDMFSSTLVLGDEVASTERRSDENN